MVQKKLIQIKQTEKKEEKIVQNGNKKNEKNEKSETIRKDVKNDSNNNKVNKVEIENEFCKGNHFVCSKFTNDQYNFVRESLMKLKIDKELIGKLDIDHLDEILNNHHLLIRYMMRQRYDSSKQIEFIIKVLKWRKENNISKIKKELLPREAIELGPVFPYKKTKTGEIVCYLRFCMYPHHQIDFIDQFSIYQLYVINNLAINQNTTWIWFLDFSHATKSNIDIKRFRFLIDMMNTYFPFANSKSIVYNLPWYLSFLKSVFFSFLPQHIKKIVEFYDSKNLAELIDLENLPPHLGGTGSLNDCELFREFLKCKNNVYFEEWIKDPPEAILIFKKDKKFEEICENFKIFLQKQLELIENLKKKGVVI